MGEVDSESDEPCMDLDPFQERLEQDQPLNVGETKL